MDNDENVVFNPLEQDLQNKSQDVVLPASPPASTLGGRGEPEQKQAIQPQEVKTSTEVLPSVQMEDIRSDFPGGGIIKKIIIGVIVLIVLISTVVFFMSRGNSNKKVKLVWWGLWENSDIIKPLVIDFQKEYPNITVEYSMQDPMQYKDRLQVRVANGTGPDIFRFHNTWIPMISNELLPLPSDVITPAEFNKNFYPVMQEDLIKNGGIYGVPMGADTLSLFINTELLESAGVKPPETWDDFVKVAKALTVKDGAKIKTSGAALGTYGNITHASDIISLLFIQQGIDLYKFPIADKSQKIDVLDFYTSFAKGDQNVWDGTLDESILSFSRGNLAMYFGFAWDILRIQAINKNLKFKAYPVPQLVGRKAALASYWAEGVSAKSENQKEALLFMKFLNKKDTVQKYFTLAAKSRGFGEPYARRDLASSLDKNTLLFPFVNQLGFAKSSFFASDTQDGTGGLNTLSNNYLGNSINSIVNDNSSSQTVLEILDQGIVQVFQKYGIQ